MRGKMYITFEDILNVPTVFQNRDALSPHYLPDKILHREKEIEKVMRALSLVFVGQKPKNVFIYGKTGTGKTSSIKYVLREFDRFFQNINEKSERKINAKAIYLNCRMYNTRYKILRKVCEDVTGFTKNGFPPSFYYEKILKFVGNGFLIIVLDEIDVVRDINEVIYTFTRANDEIAGGLAIVGISNKLAFKQQIDARSRSALLEREIVFPPYNSEQLRSILAQRVEIGFKKGACDESALSLAAAIAARETGDARYALKLLLYAGEIADERADSCVTHVHVEAARKTVEEDIIVEGIATLPEHQQLLLLALSRLAMHGPHYARLAGRDNETFLSGEVYESYVELCKRLKREARSARWCREYLRELEAFGLIQMLESGKGMRGRSTLLRLNCAPEKVKKALEELFA